MSFVLDCSAALASCFHDEQTAEIVSVMLSLKQGGAVVPAIWRLELANGLLMGIRRGRTTAEKRDILMAAFAKAPIEVDAETDPRVWPDTLRLADLHHLTIYDANYLELACRRRLALASLDRELRKAAAREGVALRGV